MSNYFNIEGYCSNSQITTWGQELGLLPSFESDKVRQFEAFRIGTLFDIMETEPHRIDRLNGVIIGTDYSFTPEELKIWIRKQKHLYSQDFYKRILSFNPDFQKEIYCDNFSLDGVFKVKFKGKLDLYLPDWVIDLKTTVATTQESFEYVCNSFGYFRQMIFYMALTGSTHSKLIGVCKSKDRVFEVNFDSSHKLYEENLNMCKLLLQKWCILN